MAGNRFKARTNPIATGTATKTLAQLLAAANHKIKVERITISFNGVSNTAVPIRVDVLRQTTAGTMGTSNSTIKLDPDDVDETIQTALSDSATAEPTAGDILFSEHVHPQQGYTWNLYGREVIVGGGDRLGVRVVSPAATVDAIVGIDGEE